MKDREAWHAAVHMVRESQTRLRDLTATVIHLELPRGSAAKDLPANAENVNSVPGSVRSSEERNDNTLRILAWGVPWTEEPGELQFMGWQRIRYKLATKQHHPFKNR